MQVGVEIHLHQGKPGVRAANTHRVDRRSLRGRSPKATFRTPVRTWTNLHLGTDSSSRECTPPNAQTFDDSSRRSRSAPARWHRLRLRYVLQAEVRAPPHGARLARRCPGRVSEPASEWGSQRLMSASLSERSEQWTSRERRGVLSSASDKVGGFSMFAPPICRRRWRNNAFPFCQIRRRRGNQAEHRSERSEQQIKRDARAGHKRTAL
jgi:hypothetical protein